MDVLQGCFGLEARVEFSSGQKNLQETSLKYTITDLKLAFSHMET